MGAAWLAALGWCALAYGEEPRPLVGGTAPVAHQLVSVEAEVLDAHHRGDRWIVAASSGTAVVEIVAREVLEPERLVPGAKVTAQGRFVGYPTLTDRAWGVVSAETIEVVGDPPLWTPMRAFALLLGLWFFLLLGLVAARIERAALLRALQSRAHPPPTRPSPPAPTVSAADLYRPLTVLSLGGAALLDRDNDPAVEAVGLEVLGAARALQARIVDALPATHETTLSAEPIDLDEIAAEAMERSQHLMDARRLVLDTKLAPADALGALEVVEAIVADLLDHVVRAAREGDTLSVQVWHDDRFAYLRIRDQGASVPPELQAASVGRTFAGQTRPPRTPRVRLAAAAAQAIGGDVVIEDVAIGASLLLHLRVPPHHDADETVML